MDTLVNCLYEWGVPKKDVKFEAFGPATVKSGPQEPKVAAEAGEQAVIPIEFARSGKTVSWDSSMANLLEFAEKNGITTIEGGCRAGSCGRPSRARSCSSQWRTPSRPVPGSSLPC